MANLRDFVFSSSICYPVVCGQSVYLCLTEVWEDRTVTGYPFVIATVKSTTAPNPCSGASQTSSCDPCVATVPTDPCDPCTPAVCCGTYYTYCLTIDQDQLLTDPATSLPYLIDPCADIVSIFPYVCTLASLMRIIDANNIDWYFDCTNSTIVMDESTPEEPVIEFTFLIKNRVTGTTITTCEKSVTLDICTYIAPCITSAVECPSDRFVGVPTT